MPLHSPRQFPKSITDAGAAQRGSGRRHSRVRQTARSRIPKGVLKRESLKQSHVEKKKPTISTHSWLSAKKSHFAYIPSTRPRGSKGSRADARRARDARERERFEIKEIKRSRELCSALQRCQHLKSEYHFGVGDWRERERVRVELARVYPPNDRPRFAFRSMGSRPFPVRFGLFESSNNSQSVRGSPEQLSIVQSPVPIQPLCQKPTEF